MDDWYTTSLGKMVDEQEKAILEAFLSKRFGYYIVQLNGHRNLIEQARVKRKFVLTREPYLWATACAEETALPIQTDSVDVALLPHTLEITKDPHQVLREVERILIPEGYVVISGFNPWSLVGARRLLSVKSTEFPWASQFYRLSRVIDWLKLLGFQVDVVERYFFVLPFQQKSVVQQAGWVDALGQKLWPFWSGGYMLLAKKQVSTLTPIKPKWRARMVSSESEVTETSQRGDFGCSKE
ncbi:MAG: methyltransferase domain-containing protein [Methylococcales bacterium]|nr:methyltransferase domain-containing protein [Methylococcales bacterium]